MDDKAAKTKVAILGGGMAALTAAFELSKTPELREAYEVTIYQMGWRLGGKCATGRGPHGRIQEHGIHGFSGSYYNALKLMFECYQALPCATCVEGAQSVGVLKSFEDAFVPIDRVTLWETRNKQLVSWPFFVAPNKMNPALYDVWIKDVKEIIERLRRMFSVQFSELAPDNPNIDVSRLTMWQWVVGLYGLCPVLCRTGLLLSIVKTSIFWFNIFNALAACFSSSDG